MSLDNLVGPNGVVMAATTAGMPANASYGHVVLNKSNGNLWVRDGGGASERFHATGVCSEEVTFTETTGAGTYTGSIVVPAGATILDVVVYQDALWSATSSATLNVGDGASSTGYYSSVNLKATDLLAGESLSFAQSGGKAGGYNVGTNTHWTNRYSATAVTISGVVVTVGAAGATGKTRLTVYYSLPRVSAATKV